MKLSLKLQNFIAQKMPDKSYNVHLSLFMNSTHEGVEELRRILASRSTVTIEEINAYGLKMEMKFE